MTRLQVGSSVRSVCGAWHMLFLGSAYSPSLIISPSKFSDIFTGTATENWNSFSYSFGLIRRKTCTLHAAPCGSTLVPSCASWDVRININVYLARISKLKILNSNWIFGEGPNRQLIIDDNCGTFVSSRLAFFSSDTPEIARYELAWKQTFKQAYS